MDGFHDLGGRQGFGPVVRDGHTEAFQSEAEIRIAAMWVRLLRHGIYNMDAYRHAIERMEPRHYVSASYYERTFTGVVSLCIERGVFSAKELSAAVGFSVQLSRPSCEGRTSDTHLPEIGVGDRVRVKNDFIPGHIRMPGYIRGKEGVVVSMSPAYPYPDARGHGLEAAWQRSFDVRFSSRHLWPDGSEEAEVQVGVFHGYLEKVT